MDAAGGVTSHVHCLPGLCVYLMCVAGRLSYCRERKSSLCRSWCFCFSDRSVSMGVSFSSSRSSARGGTQDQHDRARAATTTQRKTSFSPLTKQSSFHHQSYFITCGRVNYRRIMNVYIELYVFIFFFIGQQYVLF